MDGLLKFKWLFIILWAAEYSRVGFQNCRLPWACGPKRQKNIFLVWVPMVIYNIGNLLYGIHQLKTWYLGVWILKIHPQTAELWLGTTFMVTIVNLVPSHNSAVHGFLIFKRLHVILWAAEYHRLGFPYCRWPWALGPKIHMHKTPDFFSQLFMDSVQFFYAYCCYLNR